MTRLLPTRRHPLATRCLVALAALASFDLAAREAALAQPARIPDRLSDQEFWKLIGDVSEEGGYFRSDNLLSNERQFQYVIPTLQRTTRRGGVYLGVGPEQNFTYIAALQPRIAIIFDIRRQNMIEHLMYKALFELSPTRADFLSKLFCRPRFPGVDTITDVGVMLDLYGDFEPNSVVASRTLTAVKQSLVRHGFRLTPDDATALEYVANAFCSAGPNIDYSFSDSRGGFGRGGSPGGFGRGMPSYAELMLASDSGGTQRSYLATEANYQLLRSMQARNLIVPVVGNFAGPKAIRAIADYLKRRGATVTAFYASNVEQYLFQQGDNWRRYYENVETLPLDSRSMFIRSIGGGGRGVRGPRLGSLLSPMQEFLKSYREGRINTYGDVIALSR